MTIYDDWVAIDIETTVRNQPKFSDIVIGDFPGNPFHPDNHMVVWGEQPFGNKQCVISYEWKCWPRKVAGHNLAFDLMYYIKEYGPYSIQGMEIWDTQLAEYMLTGQQTVSISLDKLAEKYGIPGKVDGVKEWWDKGFDTTDIPKDLLEEYLAQDCNIVQIIAQKQMTKARNLKMLDLIKDRMRSLLATTLMTYTGIYLYVPGLMKLITEAKHKAHGLRSDIEADMAKVFFPDGDVKFQPNAASSKQMKAYLFGGEAGWYIVDVPVLDENGEPIRYKSGQRKGQVKTKKERRFVQVERGVIQNVKTVESTSDDVLSNYPEIPQIEIIRKWRHVNKELTMFESYLKHIIMVDDEVGVIHPSFNHAITQTGRLSSSNPNVQNLSTKEVE